ncbi:beta-mannanase [Mangrovimonas sp. CR14]|uniref:glycoside hydrolase 5 family protein n=1 Tax=Mangrovimonas sp. CR14 TaxID=2706120 RepID=UPI00141F64AD|nr:beta-mannanase [Mangrovimonas sp. CR14]NIK93594.1 beta-mannanase [Mangrovimonas sp. CR14]
MTNKKTTTSLKSFFKYSLFATTALTLMLFSCKKEAEKQPEKAEDVPLISVKDGRFFKGDQPYYFLGTNYWYGPLLGAAHSGDRERLIKELDFMKSAGIDNLRILAGAEGVGSNFRVDPSLQPEQGKYNEDLLDGLDFLLAEMKKREMYAVLYLTNNWIWSGGMSEYLQWNGYGDIPNPRVNPRDTWQDYMAYTMKFHECDPCKRAYYKHVEFIMTRTNSYTGLKYTNDNTIMSWQLANEPRVMVSARYENAYTDWVNTTVELMESLDSVHLISTGAEGKASYLQDIDMYTRVHKNKDIDYLTMHMWPKNWEWYDVNNEKETTQNAIRESLDYIDEHMLVAQKLNKPIVLSEFGFPREGESTSKEANIDNRNVYYQVMIEQVVKNRALEGHLAGLNFWGFAGYGKANGNPNGKWLKGDDFLADPPQEPQGLNSVFATDHSTIKMIKDVNKLLKQPK